ncbi:MAG: glucuronokinase [bacterium]|jgi:glucuronokinase
MLAEATVPARAGLVGHPSDGYGGATLSVTLGNFAAHVAIGPAHGLQIEATTGDGWPEGGEPLIRATVRRFCRHRLEAGATFDPEIRVRYRSTIPRKVGLAGSSAIVIATLRALAGYSGVPIEHHLLPELALSVETDELGIAAGLQDRVVQTYGGLVYMDFARRRYEPLDAALLPDLFVAWHGAAKGASAAAHAAVCERHARRERAVVAAMTTLARLARDARDALDRGDDDAFADALDAGYDVRASIFELDPRHVALVAAARELGLPATYTGSGGAIVGVARDRAAVTELAARLHAGGVQLAPAIRPSPARP